MPANEAQEIAYLKQQLETQHRLLKVILYKAGGYLEFSKADFMASADTHFQLTQWESTTRVILQTR